MKRMLQLAVLLAIVGGAVFAWRQIFPSPEEQIRRRILDLQELASFTASKGNLATLADLERLGSLFTPDAKVRLDVQGGPKLTLTGRGDIRQAAGGARRAVGNLHVKFVDVVVTLGKDKHSAVVEATGMARQADSNDLWIEELKFGFIKTEDGWLISSVETVETLSWKGTEEYRPHPA